MSFDYVVVVDAKVDTHTYRHKKREREKNEKKKNCAREKKFYLVKYF